MASSLGSGGKRVSWTSIACPTLCRSISVLQQRLVFIELLTDARKEWTAEVTGMAGDRFERRLTEEISKLRVEMTQGFAALRQDLADRQFELLKWAFLFWVGQFFAVAGLVAVVIRFLRPNG